MFITKMTRRVRTLLIGTALVALLAVDASAFRYGNWCGTGHPDNPSDNPNPIDAVDAACKEHDRAYQDGISGEADAKLIKTLADHIDSGKLEDKQLLAAFAIITYMTGQQAVTLAGDIKDGKIASATLEVVTGATVATVAIPTSLANEILTTVGKEIGGPGEDFFDVAVDVANLPLKATVETVKIVDKVIITPLRKVEKEVKRFFKRIF